MIVKVLILILTFFLIPLNYRVTFIHFFKFIFTILYNVTSSSLIAYDFGLYLPPLLCSLMTDYIY